MRGGVGWGGVGPGGAGALYRLDSEDQALVKLDTGPGVKPTGIATDPCLG